MQGEGYCHCGCGRKTTVIGKPRGGYKRGESVRYIHGHQRRKPGPDYEVTASGCWEWLRNRNSGGYGRLCIDGVQRLAHRVYYERHIGAIPDGLTLDHLCRNRACVNPAHLEPVSNAENVMRGYSVPAVKARQTHCKRGHEFTPENTYVSKLGHRDCRTCHRIDQRAYVERKRLKEAA
jgi:hypothetical protein